MQAIPIPKHLKSHTAESNLFDMFKKITPKHNTNNFVHGKLPKSIESNELPAQTLKSGGPVQTTVAPVKASTTPIYFYDDYLPPREHQPNQGNYDHTTHEPNINRGCQCDSERLDILLQQMQSNHKYYHDGIMQIFKTFKSQLNNNGNEVESSSKSYQPVDSYSAHSQQTPDYNTICRDAIHTDLQHSNICNNVFGGPDINPSSSFNEPGRAIAHGGFQQQFMTYGDYVRMLTNVNNNPKTLLGESLHPSDDIDGMLMLQAREHEDDPYHAQNLKISNELKTYIDAYTDPILESNSNDADMKAAEEDNSSLMSLEKRFKSFLDTLKPKNL